MNPLMLFLLIAGVLQLLIASSNFVAARMLDYRGNLARVSPIVREVFWVQILYIEIVLAAFAGVCFFFPDDLTGENAMGRCFSVFLAFFWGLRLLLQLVFYVAATRRQHRAIDSLFLAAQVYLTGVFVIAACGGLK
jgi:hypothetical protein